MTRIVSRSIYHIIYTLYYAVPIFLLLYAEKAFHLNVRELVDGLGIFRFAIYATFVALVFVLPGYRAKLASEAYGDRDIGFWEAHVVSGAILRTHLSFLPMVGRFFEKETDKAEPGGLHRPPREE